MKPSMELELPKMGRRTSKTPTATTTTILIALRLPASLTIAITASPIACVQGATDIGAVARGTLRSRPAKRASRPTRARLSLATLHFFLFRRTHDGVPARLCLVARDLRCRALFDSTNSPGARPSVTRRERSAESPYNPAYLLLVTS